jgi:hypothetical protein
VPIAQIDDFVVEAELQGAGVALDQFDKAGGVGETVVALRGRPTTARGRRVVPGM